MTNGKMKRAKNKEPSSSVIYFKEQHNHHNNLREILFGNRIFLEDKSVGIPLYEKQVEISGYKLNYGFKTFLNYTISSIYAMLKKLIKIKLPRTFYISSRWKNFQRFSLTLNWINIRRHLSERIPNLSNLSNEQLHVHEISKYQVVAV